MEDPTVDADGNVTPGRPSGFGLLGEGDGQPNPELLDSMQSAFEECGDLLQGAQFGFNQVDWTELQDQLIELASCLRDQGLDVADPDLSELGPGSRNDDDGSGPTPGEGGPLGIDFEDPEVRLGDMNGDGLQDIVQLRRGRVIYWPGRGEGVWGTGSRRPTP